MYLRFNFKDDFGKENVLANSTPIKSATSKKLSCLFNNSFIRLAS